MCGVVVVVCGDRMKHIFLRRAQNVGFINATEVGTYGYHRTLIVEEVCLVT